MARVTPVSGRQVVKVLRALERRGAYLDAGAIADRKALSRLVGAVVRVDRESTGPGGVRSCASASAIDKLSAALTAFGAAEPSGVSAAGLAEAWRRYTDAFGEPPHGTVAQMAALLELVPRREQREETPCPDALDRFGDPGDRGLWEMRKRDKP